ncbi:LysR family transcriptional regulator [Sinomonas atrocyanea]|jgi:DNA-binding transcriptional LysR family regulator|uniref:LysR family transcriptional regulator n=1 Tax=Sinomonas atrocyanea TaxID=37927 RepID=UPI002781BB28|nr:LysR family transcriptional regulator [Sinomonas atrocyanea]MDQ0261238.1 DNA-binding transcriptional LysR family regulator [Sinomonas atrocyanea]MDR6619828.1 DNA-binding transcriptional LysR family regulator [Sinomonas atrocyanea]
MSVRDWELRHYRFLAALAEEGSIGGAARLIGMAQPNASRLLEQMEREAGFPLARRTPRGTQLTDRGRVVAGLAAEVVGAAENVGRAVGALEGGRGTLHLCASLTVAEHLMPGWLAAAQQRLRGVSTTLDVGNSDEVFDRLRSGAADLGFVEGPTVQTGFRYLDVGRDELVVVVRPDHPWAADGEVSPAGVASAGLVVREPGSGTRQITDLVLAPHGSGERFEVGSNAALAASVAAGLGPGVVSRLAVQAALRGGRLVEVATPGLKLGRVLRAVWRASGPLDPAAGDFLRVVVGRH